MERCASSAHPIAKPIRTAPVIVASLPPANGRATSVMAEMAPPIREPATTFAEVRVVSWLVCVDMTLLVDGDARGESQLGEKDGCGGDHDEGHEAGQPGEPGERQEGVADAVSD